ncbi:phosphate binding protein [Rubidibacter lacunae KORDI 51-2]|uniref:Phosphate-binding protein n=1 Tax=Rubidibacter lacunae KORDI 51-2 TaxID=582515 RepID=U5DJN6_9CHRO|nr:phosphate binding protein [Rubidibacter lacunae KORDI 51-2]
MANVQKSKFNRVTQAGALALAAASVGIVVPAVRSQSGLVQIDGSSTVFPIAEAVAEEFQAANPGMRVTVGVSGSGGGFKKFCRGETDISNASRPIKESEIETCKAAGIEFVELEVAYDALTVVINPNNSWAETMTTDDLKKIWEPDAQGTIDNWSQVRSSWPDAPLTLFGPGADSGTFDYFTDVIVGEEGASRGDYTASEDDNVLVLGVEGDRNALGYFGYAYYVENQGRLKAVKIDSGNGPVSPSAATVENGTYTPLSRPLFVYVRTDAYAEKPQVQAYVDYLMTEGSPLVSEVGYVPLSPSQYAQQLAQLQ